MKPMATASSTRALVPLGLRVILAEYPGYGPRAASWRRGVVETMLGKAG